MLFKRFNFIIFLNKIKSLSYMDILNKIFSSKGYGNFIVLEKSLTKKYYYKIKFLNTNFCKEVSKYSLLQGKVADDSLIFNVNFDKIYKTKNNLSFKVISYIGKSKDLKEEFYKIKFLDFDLLKVVTKSQIKTGAISNYLNASIYGVGYLGVGNYSEVDNKKVYHKWLMILSRCYNKNDIRYKIIGAKGIIICDEWKCFQNFAAWYYSITNNLNWEVDKDILFNVNHLKQKIYSPETCLLIPSGLNCFIAGDCLECGVYNRKDNKLNPFTARYNNKSLGCYKTFKEAKQVYAEYKYTLWLKELNKFKNELSKEILELCKKYNFYWEV